nr:unnamed protein product [Haemonchus contortus]
MKSILVALFAFAILTDVEAQKTKFCNIKVLKRVFTDLYPVKLAGYDGNIVPHGSEFVTRCLKENGLVRRNWTSYECIDGKWKPDVPRNLDCWMADN